MWKGVFQELPDSLNFLLQSHNCKNFFFVDNLHALNLVEIRTSNLTTLHQALCCLHAHDALSGFMLFLKKLN